MQIPSVTNTNLVTDPSFELVTSSSPYVSPWNISVSDTASTFEVAAVFEPATRSAFVMDEAKTSEAVTVALQFAANKPTPVDTTRTAEKVTIQIQSPVGTTGWSVTGGSLSQALGGAYSGSYYAQLTSTGPTQYMSSTVNCTINTAYVAQCHVKGTAGNQAIISAVENGVTLNSATVTMTGGWDLLSLPSFTTDGTHTTFDIRIASATIGTGTATFVQGTSSHISAATNPTIVLNGVTTGNAIIVVLVANVTAGGSTTTPTDSALNAYSTASNGSPSGVINGSSSFSIMQAWAKNVTGGNLTITVPGTSMTGNIHVLEYANLTTDTGTNALDPIAIGSQTVNGGTFSSATTSAITTTLTNDLLLEVGLNNGGGAAPNGSGIYTNRSQQSSSPWSTVADALSGSPGLKTGTMSMASTNQYLVTLISLKGLAPASPVGVDAVMVQAANGAYPTYFDGDSGIGFAWTGTRNNSTSTYTSFVAIAASNVQSLPQLGLLVDWPRTYNASAGFFTINSSAIGGSDFIPGTQTFPTYFDQYGYTDYTTYLLSNSIQGSIGQYPYGIFASQMTTVLDNTNLLFMPGFDATIGPYILPARPIRYAVGFGGSSIIMFSGTTLRPANDLQNRTTTLISYDGSDFLNMFASQGAGPLAAASNGVYINISAELIIGDLLSEAGFFSTQYVADKSLQSAPIGYLAPKGNTAGALIQAICEAEQGIFFFDGNGVAHFWNYQHIQNQQTSVWSIDYSSIVQFTLEDTPIINDVMVQANPRVVENNQVVWQFTTGQGQAILPGATATIEADFQDANGALPVTSVITPVYLASAANQAVSTYTTSYNSSGAAADAADGSEAFISVSAVSLMGSTYIVTFANSGSGTVYVSSLNLFGTPARVHATIVQEYKSPISIGLNGTNPANNGQPIVIQNDLIQSADTAQADAYMLVNNYASPYQRMTVDIFAAPQLEFGDVVSLTINDIGQTNLYTIVGINNGINNDGEITQQLELNIFHLVHYFTIGVSSIGGTDSVSP